MKFNGEPARQIKPRKRAADFLSDDEDSEPEVDAKPAKAQAEKKASNKKTKKEDGTAAPAAKSKAANAKAAPKSKKPEVAADESDDDDSVASESGEGEEEEDDRTVALIKGFESSGDEDESGDEGYDPSKPVPKIPDSKKAKRKILKKQKDEKSGNGEEPGVVYVGYVFSLIVCAYVYLCLLVLTSDAIAVFPTVSTNTRCAHTFHNSARSFVFVFRGTVSPVAPSITLSWNSSRSPLPRSLPRLWTTT